MDYDKYFPNARRQGSLWPFVFVGIPVGGLLLLILGIHARDGSVRAKITSLEKELAQEKTFNWRLHNELRQCYASVDEHRSFHHSNVILQNSVMDESILNLMAGAALDRQKAIQNLHRSATKYPVHSFVAAACWIKAGDLEQAGSKDSLERAATTYRKVLGLNDEELAPYRQLALQRLKAIGVKDMENPGPSTAPASESVKEVERDYVKKASSDKGKAVIGVLPREDGAGSIVAAVPGSDDRVWDGKLLGGFKDLLDGKKILDDEVVGRMGAFAREQLPEKQGNFKAIEANLRAKLLEVGADPTGLDAQIAQKAVEEYFENAPRDEKQKLFDLYAERGAPIGQSSQPNEQGQIQWYQIPTNGDVRQVVRNYTPPRFVPEQSANPAVRPALPAPDVDLVGKISAMQLTLSENVYNHRPGNDADMVATQQRVITVDDPSLNNQGKARAGNTAPIGTPGATSFTPGSTQFADTSVNNIATFLQKKAGGSRNPISSSNVRSGSANPPAGNFARMREADQKCQQLDQQKRLHLQKLLAQQKELAQQRELERQKKLEHQREIDRQRELERQKQLAQQRELERQKQLERERQRQQEWKQLEHEKAQLAAEATKINNQQQDLNRRFHDLDSRIISHNLEKGQSSDVQAYNLRANRLNQELEELRFESRRISEERQQLFQRAQQLDNRAQALRSQADR